jgi:hypothetical protein
MKQFQEGFVIVVTAERKGKMTEENNELAMGEIAPPQGLMNRFVNIFVNPRKTYEAIDQKPTWLVPFLIILILTLLITQLTFPIIMKSQLEMLRSNGNIPPEQLRIIEQRITEHSSAQRMFAAIGQIVVFPLVFLILAGIFYFTGSVVLGGDSTYKKVLSVYSWSACIGVLGALIVLPLILTKGSVNISISPALLLSGDAVGSKLHTLLSKFDFFTIWFLAVFASGFAFIYRFSTVKAYTAVGLLWGIWIALSTIFSDVLKRFGM